ncbi:MAG: hypothetical protein RL131_1533 [Bacteroidota bacterium]
MQIRNLNPMKTYATGTILLAFFLSLISFTHRSNGSSEGFTGATSAHHNIFNRVYHNISSQGAMLSEEVFQLACTGFQKLSAEGRLSNDSILTIIDFSKSSREKRMFVIDLKSEKMLFNNVVAHGKNTGLEYAKYFSNTPSSHQSSLGFYITDKPYQGSNGYSLALEGIEPGFNDKARERAIVIHGAPYANEKIIQQKGYLGRSFGCPALPVSINKKIIDQIKEGNCMFVYYPNSTYLKKSKLLNG